jgi:hypothetical protein
MNLEDLYRLLRTGHVQAQRIVDTIANPRTPADLNDPQRVGDTTKWQSFPNSAPNMARLNGAVKESRPAQGLPSSSPTI